MSYFIAQIAVSKAIYIIDKPYFYLVPPQLVPTLQVGMRVLVPFSGGNRGSDGLVLSIEETNVYDTPLKTIISQLDEFPVLSKQNVQLALWMRERYYCTLFDCVRAMLPAGLFFALQDSLILQVPIETAIFQVSSNPNALKLVELLQKWGGRGDIHQIRAAFGTKDPNTAIKFLIDSNIVLLETSAKRNVGDKADTLVTLAVTPEVALSQVAPKRKSAPLRYAIIELLCQIGSGTNKEICYYTGATNQTVKSLAKSGLVELTSEEVLRRPLLIDPVAPAPKPTLNQEQQEVLEGLLSLLSNSAAALLYGVTGSGKTQVYLALIHYLLEQGRTAMVLVPEISLTPQLLRIFTAQFGDSIAILHSGLRIGERYDEWKRVRRGEATVVLGTRSAVFAPLENIGVIILDEEQENSYKSEQTPRYHAREIAKYRCHQQKALLLLGSATPSVDSMYSAKTGKYHLFTLQNRFNQGDLPEVSIIDMKEELRSGNFSSISFLLAQEIEKNIKSEEQSILFLNRRGTNRMVTCGDCGEIPMCPRCSVRLTYHSVNGRLLCHYCNFSQLLPPACPTCNGRLNFVGIGTQQVQEDLEELFPTREILRMDTDTVSAAHPHEELLSTFQKKKVPILIGTQMVAKGLDFENVTLVGVISGDLSLFIDDLWAGERTFSLITQVVGRAGRGGKKGRALIQTYTPENDTILAAAAQDYDRFYAQEIFFRELRWHPPFCEVILICGSGLQENKVLQALVRFRQGLVEGTAKIGEKVSILGPAPASIPKVNNHFRFQITLMADHSKSLRLLLAHLLKTASQDKENKTISLYINRLIH